MTTPLDHASLGEQFQEGQKLHTLIQENSDEKQLDRIRSALSIFIKVWAQFSSAALVSSNDKLEDLSTATMKYLLVPYYLGDICLVYPGMDGRLARVKRAKEYLATFLEFCVQFEFIDPQDLRAYRQPSLRMDRTAKIDQLRRQQALKEQLCAFQKRREALRPKEGVVRPSGQTLDDDAADEADGEREGLRLMLKGLSLEAVKHLQVIEQELPMLAQMEAMKRGTPEPKSGTSANTSMKSPALHSSPGLPQPPNDKQSEKPFIYKINSPAQLQQPLVRSVAGCIWFFRSLVDELVDLSISFLMQPPHLRNRLSLHAVTYPHPRACFSSDTHIPEAIKQFIIPRSKPTYKKPR
jgi:hypothetical protein